MLFETLPVNLIRQWCYCPRVVYYQELLVMSPTRPSWVKQGEDFHSFETQLWQRRDLSRFGLDTGKRHHNLAMQSTNLGLHGIVDMLIETDTEIFPIECKMSVSNKKRGDIMQLAAYGMLAQAQFAKPVTTGFLTGKGKAVFQVALTEALQQEVVQTVTAMRSMLARGTKPDTSASIHQCGACEYLNFCNDRL